MLIIWCLIQLIDTQGIYLIFNSGAAKCVKLCVCWLWARRCVPVRSIYSQAVNFIICDHCTHKSYTKNMFQFIAILKTTELNINNYQQQLNLKKLSEWSPPSPLPTSHHSFKPTRYMAPVHIFYRPIVFNWSMVNSTLAACTFPRTYSWYPI